jgi:hypothetical protein
MKAYTIEKDWEYKGLRCVVIAAEVGHRCGYVGVPKEHILFKVDYRSPVPDSLQCAKDKVLEEPVGKRSIVDVVCAAANPLGLHVGVLFNVHGGITYSGDGNYPVDSDLWWFGFDCGHYGDMKDQSIMSRKYLDKELEYEFITGGVVRTLEYCVKECESLAEQLIAIEEVK